MIVLALPIVRFLYQSGKFTGADSELTASILIAYTIGLFAWSTQAIVARGFYSMKDSRTPVIIGTLVTVLFVTANAIVVKVIGGGVHSPASACGLALVTSFAAILNTGILVVLLRRKLGGIDGVKLMAGALKIVGASGAMGLAAHGAFLFMQSHSLHGTGISIKVQAAETLVICSLVGGSVYAAMAFLLRMEETNMLIRLVRRQKSEG